MIDGRELERRCAEARAVRRADAWRHVDGLVEAIEELRVERRALFELTVAHETGDSDAVAVARAKCERLGLVP